MGLQNAIFQLEEGKGKRYLQGGGIALGLLLLILVYLLGQFRGLRDEATMEQAQLARHLAKGEGFTTSVVHPLALWQLRPDRKVEEPRPNPELDVMKLPDTMQAPLYPMLLAVAFKLTLQDFTFTQANIKESSVYAPERVMAILGLLCFLGGSCFLYFTARSLFDGRVALLALLLMLGTDLLWQVSVAGHDTGLLVLLFCGSLWAWHHALRLNMQEHSSYAEILAWLGIGAGCQALMVLTRYSLWWILPASLALIAFVFRREKVAVVLVALICILPPSLWLVRNVVVTGGNPLGLTLYASLQETDVFPKTSIWSSYPPDTSSVTIKMIGRKMVNGLRQTFESLPAAVGSLPIICLASLALLHPFRRKRAEHLKWWMLGGLVLAIAGACLGGWSPGAPLAPGNNAVIFLPVLALFAAAMFFISLDRLDLPFPIIGTALAGLLVVINAIPMIVAILPPGEPPVRYPPYYPAIIHLSSNWMQPSEVIASDLPAAVAWYGQRKALDLPRSLKSFNALNDYALGGRVKGMLITPAMRDSKIISEVQYGYWKEWGDILMQRGMPPLFPLQAVTPLPPQNAYLFFADTPRWMQKKE